MHVYAGYSSDVYFLLLCFCNPTCKVNHFIGLYNRFVHVSSIFSKSAVCPHKVHEIILDYPRKFLYLGS